LVTLQLLMIVKITRVPHIADLKNTFFDARMLLLINYQILAPDFRRFGGNLNFSGLHFTVNHYCADRARLNFFPFLIFLFSPLDGAASHCELWLVL